MLDNCEKWQLLLALDLYLFVWFFAFAFLDDRDKGKLWLQCQR